jgi:hypothetical protein
MLKAFLRSPRSIPLANGSHEVRCVPPRLFARCGLFAERRVSARRGWVGADNGLFEHAAGYSNPVRWLEEPWSDRMVFQQPARGTLRCER